MLSTIIFSGAQEVMPPLDPVVSAGEEITPEEEQMVLI